MNDNIKSILGGTFTPPAEKVTSSLTPEQQFIDAIANAGYEAPSNISFDGNIHRFSTQPGKRDKTGWYIAYDGKIHAGAFGCWKESTSINWRQDIGRDLYPAEQIEHANRMRAAKEKREKEAALLNETASETAETIWSNATSASDEHPYLQKKQVKSHGLRVTGDGRLIVPMLNESGEISSLQFISGDSTKRYLASGKSDSAFYPIQGNSNSLYIAEGYATAATIHEVTGSTVVVAFSAGQLSNVAAIVRETYTGDLVIVADHDNINENTGRKEGIYRAEQAARDNSARLIVPPIGDMDANDYHLAGHDLAALLSPLVDDDWLVAADDFCSQPQPIRWLIKGFMQREALHMVHGPSGGGKTFFVLDQMLHVAAGFDDWNGQKVRSGAVVYLAGEGHHGLRGRIAAWKATHNASSLNMWLSKAGTDLNTPEGLQKTRAAIMALPESPAVIVVDTLHRFLLGDENSAQDAKTMLDACGALQNEFKCGVILVHHTGVSDEAQHRARGSSAWRGALDIEISVVPAKDDKPMEVVCRKMKDGEPFKPHAFTIESVPLDGWFDEDGDQVFSAVLKPTKRQDVTQKADEYKARFMDAWHLSGGEYVNEAPYLSRSFLLDYLVSHVNLTESSARQELKTSANRMVGTLLTDGLMQEISQNGAKGWIILQDGESAADALLSNLSK